MGANVGQFDMTLKSLSLAYTSGVAGTTLQTHVSPPSHFKDVGDPTQDLKFARLVLHPMKYIRSTLIMAFP